MIGCGYQRVCGRHRMWGHQRGWASERVCRYLRRGNTIAPNSCARDDLLLPGFHSTGRETLIRLLPPHLMRGRDYNIEIINIRYS